MGPTLRYNAMRMRVEEEYKDEIVRELINNDASISFAYDDEFFVKQTMEIVYIEQRIAYIAMILGFIVAFIAIFNTTFISSLERTREFAIMRAFGFSDSAILQISLVENAILMPLALVLGVGLSYPLTMIFLYLIEEFAQKVAFSFTWQTIWVTLLFTIGTTIIAVIPGWIANTRQELASNLREE